MYLNEKLFFKRLEKKKREDTLVNLSMTLKIFLHLTNSLEVDPSHGKASSNAKSDKIIYGSSHKITFSFLVEKKRAKQLLNTVARFPFRVQ